ncbi:CLIP domain-containing serine protease HP8-like [Sitodiplosis mosellana]|uniref:CLIP domain-containing serine protease HP8-like n=1 Tax=Sitodiplosis mosellana TaxID=263140 RepID=UPI0024442D1D|nr:CLIP domain-containing serine protease HP8-like [Sitodiplosis mosellana]
MKQIRFVILKSDRPHYKKKPRTYDLHLPIEKKANSVGYLKSKHLWCDFLSWKMFKYIVLYYFCCTLAIEGYTDFRLHKNWPKDMDEICGELSQDRIIGGKFANLGQYPWLVLLIYKHKPKNGPEYISPDCGGSLIASSYVLSAAHCNANPITVLDHAVLGEYNTKTDPDCDTAGNCAAPVQRIKPAHIFTHKLFQLDQLWNDISVIKLEHPVKLNGWVIPICLPTGNEQFDTTAEVAGWGMARPEDELTLQSVLNYVQLPILDMDVCRMYFDLIVNGTKQICAGSVDRYEDTCGGDSGGPLMQISNSDSGPRYYQAGIVSFGLTDCGVAPAVYTRLTTFMSFILDVIGA